MNKNKGFTLIELLVVIAIIGILSSVVLASLNTARAKGADAAVKSNLNNIRAQAELYYDNTNSYGTAGSKTGVCADPNVKKGLEAAAAAVSSTTPYSCNVATAGGAWAASVTLKSATGKFWCVDSTGSSLERATDIGTGTACQ